MQLGLYLLILVILSPNLAFAAILAAGGAHSLAVSDDGTVWAWGYNGSGQLGDAVVRQSSTPLMLGKLSEVIDVAAGFSNSAALQEDGTVWIWGGEQKPYKQPVPIEKVKGLKAIKSIAIGQTFGTALRDDGTVWVWTRHKGTALARQVPELSEIAGIATGGGSTLAYDYDCTLRAWGKNNFGQLGNGDNIDQAKPVRVGSKCLTAVAINNNAAVLGVNGIIWTWGYNRNGQLADGSKVNRPQPEMVNGIDHVLAISVDHHTLALRADGTVWAWGANAYGQLGDGSRIDKMVPVQVVGISKVTNIAAGNMFSLAEKADGTVWAWGRNNFGQLGDGTTENRNTPVQVVDFEGYGLLNLHQDRAESDQKHRAAPPVYFTASPAVGVAPLKITFTAVFKIGREAKSLEWDFGDGDVSNENKPQHIYETPGTYLVTLSASYGNNIYRESLKKVVVKPHW